MARMSYQLLSRCEQIARFRSRMFDALVDFSAEQLWQPPRDGGWSIGQNLDHLHKFMRLCRRFLPIVIALELPIAVAFRKRGYRTSVANPFAGKVMSVPPGFGIRPQSEQSNPVPFDEMQRRLADELQKLRKVARRIGDDLSGQIRVWDPIVGWVNLHQVYELLRIHEEHHLMIVARRFGIDLSE